MNWMKFVIVFVLVAFLHVMGVGDWVARRLRQTQPDKRKTEVATEASRLHKAKGLRVVVAKPDGGFRIVVDGGSFLVDSNVRIGDLYK